MANIAVPLGRRYDTSGSHEGVPRSPASSLITMNPFRVGEEMRKLLQPLLERLRTGMTKDWPELDSELVLLYWLCVRHNVDPPNISLVKRNGSGQKRAGPGFMNQRDLSVNPVYNFHVSEEMQVMIRPILEGMRKVLKKEWPQLHPELALLHWLCKRRNVNPPNISLLRDKWLDAQNPSFRNGITARKVWPLRVSSTPPSSARATSSLPGRFESADACWDRALHDMSPRWLSQSFNVPLSARSPVSERSTLPPSPTYSGFDADEEIVMHLARRDKNEERDHSRVAQGECVANEMERELLESDSSNNGRVSIFHQEKLHARRRSLRNRGLRHLSQLETCMDRDAAHHRRWNSVRMGAQLKMEDLRSSMRNEVHGQFLSCVPMFSPGVLGEDDLNKLVARLIPWSYEAGEAITVEGEIGDQAFIVEQGTAVVRKLLDGRSTQVALLSKGDFFGEVGAMYDVPRTASVVALNHATVLSLSRADIWATVPEKVEKMKIIARTQVFSSVPLLMKLPPKHKVAVAKAMRSETWPKDTMLTCENRFTSNTRTLRIIEEGEVKDQRLAPTDVSRILGHEPGKASCGNQPVSKASKSVFLSETRTCKVGSFFGLLELLYGCPEQATITTLTETKTLSITFDELQELLEEDATTQMEVMRRTIRCLLLRSAHAVMRRSTPDEIEYVLDAVVVREYQPREVIFKKGELLRHVYVLESGRAVECAMEMDNITEETFSEVECEEHASPGDTVGTKCVIDREEVYAHATLMATSRCTVLQISQKSIRSLPKFMEASGALP